MTETKGNTPRIVVWHSLDAPVGFDWIARFWIVSGDPQKPRMEFHPVVIADDTEQSVIRKAKMWCAQELAKADRRRTALEKRVQHASEPPNDQPPRRSFFIAMHLRTSGAAVACRRDSRGIFADRDWRQTTCKACKRTHAYLMAKANAALEAKQ